MVGRIIGAVLFLFFICCVWGGINYLMDGGEGFSYNLGWLVGVAVVAVPAILLVFFCLAPICGILLLILGCKRR